VTAFELSGRRYLFPGIELRQRQQSYPIHDPGSFCEALNFGNSVGDLAPVHLQAVEHARHTRKSAGQSPALTRTEAAYAPAKTGSTP